MGEHSREHRKRGAQGQEHMGKYTRSTEGNSMISHWTRKCAEKAGCERRKAV